MFGLQKQPTKLSRFSEHYFEPSTANAKFFSLSKNVSFSRVFFKNNNSSNSKNSDKNWAECVLAKVEYKVKNV